MNSASAQMFPDSPGNQYEWTSQEISPETYGGIWVEGAGPTTLQIDIPLPDGFDSSWIVESATLVISHVENNLPGDRAWLGGQMLEPALGGVCEVTGPFQRATYTGPPGALCVDDITNPDYRLWNRWTYWPFNVSFALDGWNQQSIPLTIDHDESLGDDGTLYFVQFRAALANPTEVAIDIKPGEGSNSVNPNNRGVIPVAVISSSEFDATELDPATVMFGPNKASPAHGGHVEDVDGDGLDDMVFHFKTQDAGIECGDTEARLIGGTFPSPVSPRNRFWIDGTDAIATTGCHISKRREGVLFQNAAEAGPHLVTWDGTDEQGLRLGSGLYFYRVTANGQVGTGRMLMLK